MADKKKAGFQTVKEDAEEFEDYGRRHRRAVAKGVLITLLVLVLIFVVAELYLALRSFTSYSVLSESDREDSAAVCFDAFANSVLKYSNDGAVLTDGQNKQIWNQSYEMTTPTVARSDDYLVVFDRGGIDLYLMTATETVNRIETQSPIYAVAVSDQGTVAVLTKEEDVAKVELYDKSGDQLAGGQFYQEKGSIPVDIALSYDGKKLALDMVDISDGNLKSTITFYNFGSVGQNEIDNNVGSFAYSDMFIPEIEYVSDNKMIALGDNEILVFSGSEKPEVESELYLDGTEKSIAFNGKRIAIVTENAGEDEGYHLTLYDFKGKSTMEIDTTLDYEYLYFLENGEICLATETACQIYSSHGIRKFDYEFEEGICRILSQGRGAQYIFVMQDATKEVRLK